MDAKAEKGVLVDYEGNDGYRIFVQPGRKVCRSTDVIFDENIIASTTAFDWPVNASPEVHEDNCTPKREDQKNDVHSDDSQTDVQKKQWLIAVTVTCRIYHLCSYVIGRISANRLDTKILY